MRAAAQCGPKICRTRERVVVYAQTLIGLWTGEYLGITTAANTCFSSAVGGRFSGLSVDVGTFCERDLLGGRASNSVFSGTKVLAQPHAATRHVLCATDIINGDSGGVVAAGVH